MLATADTSTIDSSDLDVATVTPSGSPGVSDDVVVLATLVSVSNDGDGVVESGWAGGGVEDTASVLLEVSVASSEGNGEDTLVGGSLVLGGSSCNRLPGRDSDGTRSSSASSISGSVWVLGGEHLWLGLEVVPGRGVPSTVATVWDAVNKLLLREVEELLVLSPVGILGTSGGTESPAGTTSTLVLDGTNTALRSPVLGTVLALIEPGWLGIVHLWDTTEVLGGLHVSHGGEHVVTELERVLLSVDGVDLSILLHVNLESEVVLLLGSVGETLDFHVFSELLVKLMGALWLEESLESENGGGFGELHHL